MAVNKKCCSYGEEISAVALRVLMGPNDAAQAHPVPPSKGMRKFRNELPKGSTGTVEWGIFFSSQNVLSKDL